MKKGENYNHPKKGSHLTVEPIRKVKDIKLIKKLLSDKPLDLAIFTLGINTNLRASDLLQIRVHQVRDIKARDILTLKEKKTGKERRIPLNQACIEVIHTLLQSRPLLKDTDYLLTGKRGRLTVPSLNLKVKSWCRAINLRGRYGSHTLRKTWGYHQHHTFHQPLPVLMVCFNHSSQKQTLDYLCIEPEEIENVYMNEL